MSAAVPAGPDHTQRLLDAVPLGMVLAPSQMVTVLGEAAAALRFMLLAHGIGGIVIGLLLCLDNPHGLSFRVLSAMPGWPWTWGLILACAGTATTIGRLGGWIAVTRTGAVVQAAWYLAQFLGFAAGTFGGANRYPVLVYVVFAVIMIAHLRWLHAHGGWRP